MTWCIEYYLQPSFFYVTETDDAGGFFGFVLVVANDKVVGALNNKG